jgi:hypothetical protein
MLGRMQLESARVVHRQDGLPVQIDPMQVNHPKPKHRALVIVPPINLPALSVMDFTFDYVANFPLASLKLASFYRTRGYDVEFLDCMNIYSEPPPSKALFHPSRIQRMARAGNYEQEGQLRPIYRIGMMKDQIYANLLKLPEDVDTILISSIFTYSWQTTWEVIELCRDRYPQARVILGGIYPTLCYEHAMQSGATEIVRGHVPEIANQWIDLDIWKRTNVHAMSLKTSIGCNNRCSYCAVRMLEGKATVFEYSDILSQLDTYIEHGLTDLHFWDSDILFKKGHFEAILDHLIDSEHHISLSVPSGFSLLRYDAEIANKMRQAGFKDIIVPLETTRSDKLQEFHRKHLSEKFSQAVAYSKEAGFEPDQVHAVIMMGYPGQNTEDVLDDLAAIIREGILISLRVYTPIPGTEDYSSYRNLFEDRTIEDLDSFLFPLASPDLPVAFLEDVFRYFNLRLLTRDDVLKRRDEHEIFERLAKRL